MRPKQQHKAHHNDLFRARLNQIINIKHEPVRLLRVTYGLKCASSLRRLLKVKRKESQKADADRNDREIRIVGDTRPTFPVLGVKPT